MKIGIKKENGNVYIQKLIGTEQEEQIIDLGFKVVNIEHEIDNICLSDFNEDLTFNLEKYNLRKQKENIEKRINELISLLEKTDYKAIQFAEGELSAEEYLPIKQKRRSYRVEINSLEEKLKNFA